MKSYQRIIRENKIDLDYKDIFGIPWHGKNLKLQDSLVMPINYKTASSIILEYEWIGTMPLPKSCRYMYGIYFDGLLGGAEVFVEPSTRQFKDILPRKVVQLNRGACAHWTPNNTASYFLGKCIWMLKNEGIKIITAYCTKEAGEYGTIYQALNFWYIGETEPSKIYWLDNHWISERTLADKIKWARNRDLRWMEKFNNLESRQLSGKYKYIKLIGSKKENKEISRIFNWIPLEYPKRININK